MGNRKERVFLVTSVILILTVFFTTRLYKLDEVPFGTHWMHIDELGAAYDAFCISEYGVDQFLYHMPVYFKCFGEGQNALYTYLAAIVFKLAGISIFKFRLVAVICATAAIIALYFLTARLLDRWSAVVAMALMTIMPVFLMSEHWGLEAYLMMSFVIMSMSLQIHAITTGKPILYFLTGMFWGLTLYTYALSYIIVPIFFLISFAVLIVYKKLNIRNAMLAGIPLLILSFPLLIQQFVMMGLIQPFSFYGIVDFWDTTHYRGHDISTKFFIENLTKSFWYIYVADHRPYDANPAYGNMYYISIPFILIGMFTSAKSIKGGLKTGTLNLWIFNWIYFIVARLFLLFVKEPNVNRVNGIYPAYLLFAVYGIKFVSERINKKTFYIVIGVVYAVCFLSFSRYFYSYDGLQSDAFGGNGTSLDCDIQAAEAAALAKKIAMGRQVYALLNDGWQRHLSIALYTETSPYKFNRDHEPQDRSFNGVEWSMPDGLDLTGNTVYLIDNNLGHITSYLSGEGFNVDITYPDYTVVYR